MQTQKKGLQVQTTTRHNKIAKNTPIVNTAISYINAGLSVVPANSSTKYTPKGFQWKKYQTERMIKNKAKAYFHNVDGIAIICGKISGGLEAIDFDNHFGDAKQNFTRFCNIKELKPILKDMVAEKTPGGGYHVYFRCKNPNHSKKIAERWMEKEKRPDAIIEIKGEGGLILCAPSIGYELIGNTTFDNIKFIEEAEKKLLYQHMYSFNEYVRPDRLYQPETCNSGQNRPGDEYNRDPNAVTEVISLLKFAGWKSTDNKHWTRPRKNGGTSATLDKCEKSDIPLFYVFSSNAYPFEPCKAYNPFQVKALLEYGGDFHACSKDLAQRYNGELKSPVSCQHGAKTGQKSPDKVTPNLSLAEKDAIIYNEIQSYGMRWNMLDQHIYTAKGEQVADRHINDIAIRCRAGSGKVITENSVHNILRSSLVPSFHPFDEYIKIIEKMPLKSGVVKDVLNCLILDGHNKDYADKIIVKWFGGIMGTLKGNFSVMTLVFIGAQGVGKTNFFRSFLPGILAPYFAEGTIMDDKDTYARLCSNLILYDDEFMAKNKTEASVYKKLTSADKFTYRRPYGRLDETRKRTAVLCGSANEMDVISDRTGNRRIIPVRLKSINHERLSNINIDAFYRELLEMHNNNPIWWYLSDDDITLLNKDTIQNMALNVEEELLQRFTRPDKNGHVSTTEVMQHISNYQPSYRINEYKLGRALTKLYGKSKSQSIKGKRIRGYAIKKIVDD